MNDVAIQVLEQAPWYSAGLRREWSDFAENVFFRSRATECRIDPLAKRQLLTIIDFDKSLEQGLRFLKENDISEPHLTFIAVLHPEQKSVIGLLMELGCRAYFYKPLTIYTLQEFCQRTVARIPTIS